MTSAPSVLIVDDQVGDIGWLIDLVQSRGYVVVLATNGDAAQKQLDAVKQGHASYALAIIDVMVAVKDLADLLTLDEQFIEDSKDTGIRLCQHARQTLGLAAEDLPIVCVSIRDDQKVRKSMRELGIQLFDRTPHGQRSIRGFVERHLPEIGS